MARKPNIDLALGRYLAMRPRSEREIRVYLERKAAKYQLTESDIERKIGILQQAGVLNDVLFAEAVTHAVISKGKGRQYINQKLKLAGLSREQISQAVEAIDPEDVRVSMQKRLEKRAAKLAAAAPNQQRMAAYSVLLQAGFSSSEIGPFLDDWFKKR